MSLASPAQVLRTPAAFFRQPRLLERATWHNVPGTRGPRRPVRVEEQERERLASSWAHGLSPGEGLSASFLGGMALTWNTLVVTRIPRNLFPGAPSNAGEAAFQRVSCVAKATLAWERGRGELEPGSPRPVPRLPGIRFQAPCTAGSGQSSATSSCAVSKRQEHLLYGGIPGAQGHGQRRWDVNP